MVNIQINRQLCSFVRDSISECFLTMFLRLNAACGLIRKISHKNVSMLGMVLRTLKHIRASRISQAGAWPYAGGR